MNRTASYRVEEEAKYQTAAAEMKIQKTEMQDFMQNPVWTRVKIQKNDTEVVKNAADLTKVSPNTKDTMDTMDTLHTMDSAKLTSHAENSDENGNNESGNSENGNNASGNSESGVEEEFFSETSELPESASDPVLNPPEEKERPAVWPTQLDLFEEKILKADNRSRFRIIGQVFETYWLVQFEDKLMMIDQHAAHEKVNYERLMKQYREKSVVSQTLMPPVIVSLSGQEESVLKENLDVFTSLGFEVEAFGGSEYALRSVPADLYGCNEREMFLEVLDQLAEGTNFGNIRVIEEKIASMSCKAAVKGNQLLSFSEAEALIDELLTLDNPYNCPHGRPTVVSMTKYEMERKFKRIVD